jgi:hypothetical protein
MSFSINGSLLPYDEVRRHFENHPDEFKKNQIQGTLDLLERKRFLIVYITKKISSDEEIIFQREIHITNENLEDIKINRHVESIAHFSINGTYDMNRYTDYFDSGKTIDMGIGSENTLPSGETLREREISRIIIGELLIQCLKEYPMIRDDQLLFIDSDASELYPDGERFWDKIGMKENNDIDRNEGKGYEKQIDFQTIFRWVFKQDIPRNERINGSSITLKSKSKSKTSKKRRRRGGKKRKTVKYIKKNKNKKIKNKK